MVMVVVLFLICTFLLAVAAGQYLRLGRYEAELAQLKAQHATLQALYADRTCDLLAINSRIVLDYHRTRRNTQ